MPFRIAGNEGIRNLVEVRGTRCLPADGTRSVTVYAQDWLLQYRLST